MIFYTLFPKVFTLITSLKEKFDRIFIISLQVIKYDKYMIAIQINVMFKYVLI